MKSKVLAIVLICLFSSFCTISSKVKTQAKLQMTLSYENYTFDEVWRGCEKALMEARYLIEDADKDRGYILAKTKISSFESEDEERQIFHLKISISVKNGIVSLNLGPRIRPSEYKKKRALNRFLGILNKILKKQHLVTFGKIGQK